MNDGDPQIHDINESTQWVYERPGEDVIETPEPKRRVARGVAAAAGLVLAGALVGTVAVDALQGSARTSGTTSGSAVGDTAQDGSQSQAAVPEGALPPAGPGRGGFD
ncbi:MAG: hypothetical protein QOE05_968, partial [Actinomycetota bacterium]|nr:hypothetical protein [Actinomycetota bacterium]